MDTNALRNPVRPLSPEEGALDTYKKYGYMMFPQQRKIYENIKNRIPSNSTVLEVGCGIGLGTALLDRSLTTKVIGTDNLIENVKLARALYPWIQFEQWDVQVALNTSNYNMRRDTIVAVEVLEHVENAKLAIKNMCNFAMRDIWLSTPNGINKKKPPENPYHCYEYTAREVIDMIPNGWKLEILEYTDFTEYEAKISDPLVYHLTKVTK